MSRNRLHRGEGASAVLALGFCALTTVAGRAQASEPPSCRFTFKAGEAHERQGQLLSARDAFFKCGAAECGHLLERECAARLARLEHDIPTIVFSAQDAAGVPVTHVAVDVDGMAWATQLDGKSRAIDPGPHEIRFRTATGMVVQQILVLQGQRNRIVSVTVDAVALPSGPPAPPPRWETAPPPDAPRLEAIAHDTASAATQPSLAHETTSPAAQAAAAVSSPGGLQITWPAYLSAGIGVAGLGVGALLNSWGQKDNTALAHCSPACNPASLDHIRHLYTGANIAFGVGVAAIVTSVIIVLTSGDSGPAPSSHLDVAIVPSTTGGTASISSDF